jgi:DNA-binding MarR family transcriptional regulator
MTTERKAADIEQSGDWLSPQDPIPHDDWRAGEALLSALEPISDLRDRPIPLAFVLVFLSVALKEGRPVGEYAERLRLTRFATYKYIQSLGDRGRHEAPGLGLVDLKRGYRVKTAVVLTEKGRAVASEVFRRLRER